MICDCAFSANIKTSFWQSNVMSPCLEKIKGCHTFRNVAGCCSSNMRIVKHTGEVSTLSPSIKYKKILLTSLSPCLGLLAFLGKRMSLVLYSFNLWTLAWRDSVERFFRRWSTEMPMLKACFGDTPAVCQIEWNKSYFHFYLW